MDPADPVEKIKVLYIAGSLRSGSTLMGKLLGQVEGLLSVGEVASIWKAGFMENLLCGCGKAFRECDFWRRVIDNSFGSSLDDIESLNALIELQKPMTRIRKLPFLKHGRLRRNFEQFASENLYPLYLALKKVGGGKMVVDSSKVPAYLYILSKCDFIDLRVLHLIRDSRAVAYSWTRKKLRPEIGKKAEYMRRYSSFKSSRKWMSHNIMPLLVKRGIGDDRYIAVRYEDMMRDPRETVRRVLEFVGVESDLSFFADDFTAKVGTVHSVLGNPIVFDTGEVKIRYDDEWKGKLSPSGKAVSMFMTYPLMRMFYGFGREN
jgi:hypothetical protein